MKNEKLDSLFKKAEEVGSYFVTATIRDKNKTENDLTHFTIQEDFPIDDIIPSVDSCLKNMNIRPPRPVDVFQAESPRGDKKPLKIAILTHFNRAPESYSPARAVKNQVKILREHGHEVVFFTQEGSDLDLGCEMRHVVTKFKREKNVVDQEAKMKFIDVLRENLTTDFDLAITHDFYIDDCITYREAIKECGVPIKWLHWARSGVGHKIDFNMPNARYVYMNNSEVGTFASRIGADSNNVRVVFNEKEPAYMFGWHPITKMVVNKFQLWTRDIIQTYPICTTRMDAKGLNAVLAVFVELKRLGNKVALVVCNANGRRRLDEIKHKMEEAKKMGLNEDEFIFTSTLSTDEFNTASEVPNKVVTELQQLSNLFVFPTIAEVCPNILLEASMTKNLIVINDDLPCLKDFVDPQSVLAYPFTSRQSIHYSGKDEEHIQRLAKQINGNIKANKADMQFRHVWRVHNTHSIYYNQLEPILYE